MALAERLRLLMERRGLNQTELARQSGVKQPTINKMLKGRIPVAETIRTLETFFGTWLIEPPAIEESESPSLKAYLESTYCQDDKPTPDEIRELRTIQWRGRTEGASPRAWSKLLETIRLQQGGNS
jgi:transcriptional regulator with XRE-family HTH domain